MGRDRKVPAFVFIRCLQSKIEVYFFHGTAGSVWWAEVCISARGA